MALTNDDRQEILELAARYNHAIDTGDGPAWAATFTNNGIFDSPGQHFEGTEELVGMATGFPTQVPGGRHWTNNHVIDASGDGATHTCYLNLMSVTDGAKIIATGLYNDELVKVDGAWRYTHRTVTIDS
jgi:uncharacterized protein (TIGR02246 family)